MKSFVSLLTALAHRSGQGRNHRLLIRFLLLLLFFFVLYSVLFHLLMLREGTDHSWMTGFYWTLTVMTTLGFGDITFAGDLGRFFSVVVLLTGVLFLLVILPFTFIQFFYAPWLEAQNQARAPRSVPERTSGHVILTHFDGVAVNLIGKLNHHGIPSVLLIPDLTRALELHDQGYRVMRGELDDPETYRRMRAGQAALAVVLNGDLASTNIASTIREVTEGVPIVTDAEVDDSLDILQLAGSTHVFQFTRLLGKALGDRVLGSNLEANVIGHFDRLLIAEAPVMGTRLQGQTLAESRLRERTGATAVGVRVKGRFETPSPHRTLDAHSILVLAGTADQLEAYDRLTLAEARPEARPGPVLILGGGRVGQVVASTLKKRGIDHCVVEKRPGVAALSPNAVVGSAADRQVLENAGLEQAPTIVVTTHDDDLNIYLVIYCRKLRSDAQIISRASLDRNVNTLYRAGADLVLSFSTLCAATIFNLLRPGHLLVLSEDLFVFRAGVGPALTGRSLKESFLRERTGCSVIALQRGEELIASPDPSIVPQAEDELILAGSEEAEKKFLEAFRTTKGS